MPAAGSADFLSALIAQLLAGSVTSLTGGTATGTAPATDATTPAATAATTTPLAPVAPQPSVIPALLNLGIDADTASAIAADPKATALLAKLTEQIKSVKDEIDQGKQPDDDQLKDLGDTIDALVAMLAAPAQAASATTPIPAPDLTQTLDPLAATGQSTNKPKTDDLAGLASDKTSASPATPTDQAQQYLASLGIPLSPLPQLSAPAVTPAAGPDTTGGAIAPATPQQPLPAIAELATKLADLSQALAPASPDLAKKLTALADKLQSAETDPATLAQLTTPTDSSATALDKIVRELLGMKPVAQPAAANTPAAPTTLSVTDAVAPAATPAVTTAPAATTAPTVTKLTVSAKPAASSKADTTADAKIIATAAASADAPADKSAATDAATATTAAAPTIAAPRAIPAAYQAVANPINMNQVAFEMVRQLHQGQTRFTLRIDPPELGRVDVKMHVDASGNVNARLTVARSETLDMFQRDKGALEKALTQAGLDSGKTNLEFSLRQNPFAGMTGGDQRPSGNNSGASFALAKNDTTDDTASVPSVVLYSGVASAGGLNLFV